MAIANELTIDTNATALQMAETIFGDGIQIVSASYTGAAGAAGVYSGALSTIPGVTDSDSGVILSTGRAVDFTNSSGTADTNISQGTGTDNAGVDGDPDMNAVAGQQTFDAAIFEASFIPEGDQLTMRFVFSSEEYPEYVNLNVNDSFGVWVNGQFVEATVTTSGNIAIDNVNAAANQNLYRDNGADQFNTEMDGLTYVLSFKAPVNAGQVNTIKIGIADGGDAVYDSNVLISGDSIQTIALAFDDEVQLTANSTRLVEVLANDRDLTGTGLTITGIMGQEVAPGQTVTLATGEQVTLNPDGTLTVTADGDIGSNVLTYTIMDGAGNLDTGYLTINTVAAAGPDHVVQGTAAGEVIDISYTGDPDGDRVDHADNQTGDDADLIFGYGGNDTIHAGQGDDTVYGGTGDDVIHGGAGANLLEGGDGRDVIHATGADTVDGGEGGDDFDILVVDGIDSIAYSGGDDESGVVTRSDGSTVTFSGIERIQLAGANPDGLIWGSGGGDLIGAGYIDANGDVIDNNDAILSNPGSDDDEIYAIGGNDTIRSLEGDDRAYGGTGNDLIETGAGNDYAQGDEDDDTLYGGEGDDFLRGDAGNDLVHGDAGDDSVYGGAGNDLVYGGDGHDEVYGGYDDDTVYGGAGNDTITGSGQHDLVYGGEGDDLMHGSDGDDTLIGGEGADTMLGEEDADTFYGGAGDYVDGYESTTTGEDNDTLYVEDVASVSLDPGNPENGTVFFNGGGSLVFYNIENLYVDGVLYQPPPDHVVEGGEGDDVIDTAYAGDPEGDRVDAGDAADGSDDDLILAYGGNDLVEAGAGDDSVHGGTGSDTLDGGIGADTLHGDEGDDLLRGSEGDDRLYGGVGNDTLEGGDGADRLEGGDDRDLFLGGIGDSVDGGEGGDDHDTLDLTGLGPVNVVYDSANPENGTVEFLDGDGAVVGTMTFSNIENVIVPCFTPGTLIATDRGEIRVEKLREGDRVLTRDSGYQDIRWIGRRDLTAAELAGAPQLNPVRIRRGALGLNLPERDLVVSPQHRMLVTGSRAELLFGEQEVLVAAAHLAGRPGIVQESPAEGVSYIHILFDRHEIVRANGAWSESYQPGALTLAGMEDGLRRELLTLFPELRLGNLFPAARLSLKKHEALLLTAA